MALALTSLRREIQIDDTHSVNTNCDFSKAVYVGGNIEKYGDSFPSWIHDIVNADITNKAIHQHEYFKFMQLGKSKRKELQNLSVMLKYHRRWFMSTQMNH